MKIISTNQQDNQLSNKLISFVSKKYLSSNSTGNNCFQIYKFKDQFFQSESNNLNVEENQDKKNDFYFQRLNDKKEVEFNESKAKTPSNGYITSNTPYNLNTTSNNNLNKINVSNEINNDNSHHDVIFESPSIKSNNNCNLSRIRNIEAELCNDDIILKTKRSNLNKNNNNAKLKINNKEKTEWADISHSNSLENLVGKIIKRNESDMEIESQLEFPKANYLNVNNNQNFEDEGIIQDYSDVDFLKLKNIISFRSLNSQDKNLVFDENTNRIRSANNNNYNRDFKYSNHILNSDEKRRMQYRIPSFDNNIDKNFGSLNNIDFEVIESSENLLNKSFEENKSSVEGDNNMNNFIAENNDNNKVSDITDLNNNNTNDNIFANNGYNKLNEMIQDNQKNNIYTTERLGWNLNNGEKEKDETYNNLSDNKEDENLKNKIQNNQNQANFLNVNIEAGQDNYVDCQKEKNSVFSNYEVENEEAYISHNDNFINFDNNIPNENSQKYNQCYKTEILSKVRKNLQDNHYQDKLNTQESNIHFKNQTNQNSCKNNEAIENNYKHDNVYHENIFENLENKNIVHEVIEYPKFDDDNNNIPNHNYFINSNCNENYENENLEYKNYMQEVIEYPKFDDENIFSTYNANIKYLIKNESEDNYGNGKQNENKKIAFDNVENENENMNEKDNEKDFYFKNFYTLNHPKNMNSENIIENKNYYPHFNHDSQNHQLNNFTINNNSYLALNEDFAAQTSQEKMGFFSKIKSLLNMSITNAKTNANHNDYTLALDVNNSDDNFQIEEYDRDNGINLLEKFEKFLKPEKRRMQRRKNKFKIFSDTNLHYIENCRQLKNTLNIKNIPDKYMNDSKNYLNFSEEKDSLFFELEDSLLTTIISNIMRQSNIKQGYLVERKVIFGNFFFFKFFLQN